MTDANELEAEWLALRARSYPEEGIPVIVGMETVGAAAPCKGEPEVADEFRALADALATAEKASPATVIEVIAARALQKLNITVSR